MVFLVRLLKVLLGLAIIALGFWFASENKQPVSLVLAGMPLPEVALGLWILGSLLVGVLVGCLTGLLPWFKSATALRRQARQLKRYEAELSRLRTVDLSEK